MLDTLTLVETPEGISVQLRSAGAMPRAAAWALDALIRFGVLWALSVALGLLGATGMGLYLLALFATVWGYPVLFEVLRDGQTPGKRVMGLRVVCANGAPVGWLPSIVRNLMRTVDMLPMCYAIGLVGTLVDSRSRRLGDIVGGTLVVHAEGAGRAGVAPEAPRIESPLSLRVGERAAIVEFAERSAQLTPERQEELAMLLPMLTRASGALAVQRLHGLAAGFLGR